MAMGVAVQFRPAAGLLIFGVLFAVNSALHSYLIVSYAQADGIAGCRLLLHGKRAGSVIGNSIIRLGPSDLGVRVLLYDFQRAGCYRQLS